MKTTNQPIAPEVQALMVQTRHQVAARLHKLFQMPPMIAAIGQERAGRLTEHTALGGSTLGWVSAEVREAIIERRPEHKLGIFGLWHVVDAIGCLGDCAQGRWPYFTDENRRTRLQWASDEMDEVERAVMQAMEPAEEQLEAEGVMT